MPTTIRSHEFHRLWLKVSALIIASFAPVFFLATLSATSAPAALILDIVSWPMDGAPDVDVPAVRYISALSAGFLLGWGVLVWALQAWVYDDAPDAVRRSVVLGFVAWFLIDTLGSVLSGIPLNAVFNTIVLFLGVGPLWRPALEPSLA